MKHELPQLPYGYDELAPHIDQQTMKIHHSKHHQAYIDKLNAALEQQPELRDMPLEALLSDLERLPEDIRGAVQNNGGGHFNHSLFWNSMSPDGGGEPKGELAAALDQAFGSFEQFKKNFTDAALGQFGSGWSWLVVHEGKLEIVATANQDTPLSEGKTPLVGLDVWEHAYYLNYQNKRAAYVDALWNVVNWGSVSERFEDVTS